MVTIGAVGLRVAGWMRRQCPDRWVGVATSAIGDAAWLTQQRRRRALADNMRRLTSDRGAQDARRFARRTFRHLIRCNADLLAVPGASPAQILDTISVSGLGVIEEARRSGRGVLVVGAHLGNFELAAIGIAAIAGPASALVESVNPDRDAVFSRLRTGTGLRLIAADARAPREALRVLRRGEVLIVAGDRLLQSGRSHLVPFARGRRPLPEGPAWLAVQSGAAVVTGYVVRTPGAMRPYAGVFESVLSTDDLGTEPVAMLTTRIAERLGAAAMAYPDQWFVFDADWQDSEGAA